MAALIDYKKKEFDLLCCPPPKDAVLLVFSDTDKEAEGSVCQAVLLQTPPEILKKEKEKEKKKSQTKFPACVIKTKSIHTKRLKNTLILNEFQCRT